MANWKSARLPVDDPLSGDRRRTPTWTSRAVPRRLALRALAVDLRAPARVVPGEPAPFRVSIRNRLPIPVSVTLPTAQFWGWAVDGVPEGDARGFEPPHESRTVTFARRERRVFEGHWDGTIRHTNDDGTGDVWEPLSGTHTLSAYLAVSDPAKWKLTASADVVVDSA